MSGTSSSSSANSAQWQPLRPTSIASAPHGGGREEHLELARGLEKVFSGPIYIRSEDDEARARASNLCSINENEDSSSLGEQETESEFLQSTRLYNAAAPLAAWMVVRPRNVQDVSAIVKYCADKGLSPSIKSGGFSTAGWAIQGDVVLDMRLMDGVVMLLPKTFQRRKRSKWSVDVAMDELANGNKEEVSAKLKASGGNIDFATVDGGFKAKARNVSSIDSRAHSKEFAAGDASLARNGLRETKRRRDEQDGEEMSRNSCATPDSPRTRSAESGAEADTESGKSQTDVTMNSETSSPSQKENDEPEPVTSTSAGSSESPGQRSRATSSWIDRTLEESTGSGSGSQSGSNAAMSRSGTSNPTSGEAEADSDSKEPGMGGEKQQQQQSPSPWTSDWDPNSTFEHERWQRHHCPPGSAVNRVQLPSSGGFVWTANDADASGQVTGGRISNTTEPVYRGGSTFNDLHSRNVSSSHLSSTASQSISDSNSNPLPPGIHKEQYALVEIGPGVGIRGLDTFSDRAGRLSIFDDDEDDEGKSARKGKGKEEQDSLSVSEQGIDIVARGMPYHVPLSAYPVGSTALTIGGFGYLSRAYGLSLDNVVEIEIVLADGRIMVLNEASQEKSTEERDLWWAVRGAAPCFGVVTRLVAKAYPVPKVYAGSLIFPFNPITAPSLLRHWRDCLKGTGESVPRELYSNLILSAGPPSGARENVIVIQVCYLGTSSTDEVGNSFVQAICSWTGERVLLKDVTEKSFLDQQDGVAQVLKSGNRRRWMVRSDLVSTLTDESIYKTVEQFQQMGRNRAVWLFELIGGAIEDEKGTCISAQQRSAKFTVAALQQWLEVEEDERCVKAVDRWVSEVMSGISTGGPFPCFLEREESTARCEGSFGKDNFQRLVEIKKQVDPNGLFRHTFAQGLTTYL